MEFTVASMNAWLYPDSSAKGAVHEISLDAVRGGSAGFQVLLTGAQAGRLTVLPAAPADGVTVEAYRELSVYVNQNTGPKGFTADWATASAYATREAPFRVYDALEPVPEGGLDVEAGTVAVYISLAVARDCAPGAYEGSVRIGVGGEEAAVALRLNVADAVLPAESLKVTNWFSVGNMAKYHGLEKWSEAHWSMIAEYGRLMRRMHQNVFWITWDVVDASVREDGSYAFDFAHCKRLIELYLGMGFTTIEGSPIYSRDNWDAVEFNVNTPKGRVKALSDEAYEFVAALLTAWHDFLVENGWYGITIQHVGDEPHEWAAAEYRILSGIVRKFMPGVPLIDAIETHELQGSLDIWVPKNDYYAENRAHMERLRSLGDDIWFYTCCKPGGHYSNRVLDMPLQRIRMLHWGNFRYDISGYLHWGLNHWKADQNPYELTAVPSSPTTFWPAGDTNIVYPLGDRVIGSMRAEIMKSGAEDYELLRAAERKHPEEARAVCESLCRAFNDCDNTPEEFAAAYRRLLNLL